MKKKQILDSYESVKDKALRLLEFRSHSERELSDKLRRAGASDEHIELVLDFCRNYGFVNDLSYAQSKAADLFRLKKYGKRRIYNELKMLGIPDEYIDLDSLDSDEELNNLRALAARKLNGDHSQKNKDKCIRFLIYRGYDLYDIKSIIQDLINEAEQS